MDCLKFEFAGKSNYSHVDLRNGKEVKSRQEFKTLQVKYLKPKFLEQLCFSFHKRFMHSSYFYGDEVRRKSKVKT